MAQCHTVSCSTRCSSVSSTHCSSLFDSPSCAGCCACGSRRVGLTTVPSGPLSLRLICSDGHLSTICRRAPVQAAGGSRHGIGASGAHHGIASAPRSSTSPRPMFARNCGGSKVPRPRLLETAAQVAHEVASMWQALELQPRVAIHVGYRVRGDRRHRSHMSTLERAP